SLLRRAARAANSSDLFDGGPDLADRGARRLPRIAGADGSRASRALPHGSPGAAAGGARLHAGLSQPEIPAGGHRVAPACDRVAMGRLAAPRWAQRSDE